MRVAPLALVALVSLVACGGPPPPRDAPPEPTAAPPPEPTAAPPPAALVAATPADAPEISRALGEPAGFVVLWPRTVPASAAADLGPLAERVQRRLGALVERAVPGAAVDVRPAPERVCPRAGCRAMSVGAVVAAAGKPGRCVVVAYVAGAGVAPARLVPWVGDVVPRVAEVPFREPPESHLTVKDWADCTDDAGLAAGEEAVVQALRELEAARLAR